MSTSARRRLLRDFRRIQKDPPSGVTACPMDNDVMKWQAVIFGPDDTPWEGGTFNLVVEFSEEYPNKAPKVRFITKMFHPNIYNDGQICLDILQNQWSPIYDISAILTSIQSLLSDPNPASPANSEAAELYNEDRRTYNTRVRELVEKTWVAGSDGDDDDDSSSSSDSDDSDEDGKDGGDGKEDDKDAGDGKDDGDAAVAAESGAGGAGEDGGDGSGAGGTGGGSGAGDADME